jgi:protein gp37
MGADSNIPWCDDTLNVWEGCEKVSPGCKHCYAEVDTPVRVHRARGLELWGPKAPRYETKGWRANLRKYVREARRTGVRRRVFTQSLSDTFEDYRGGRVLLADGSEAATLDGLRARFFDTIDHLDDGRGTSSWAPSPVDILLLTKRSENILKMVPKHWLEPGCWPSFVWVGATVEDQQQADKRIPDLLKVPAGIRFLSVEPQVGSVDLSTYMPAWFCDSCGAFMRGRGGVCVPDEDEASPCCSSCKSLRVRAEGVSWVIQGGESGPRARPFDLAWMYDVKAQCAAAGVAWLPKQIGGRPVYDGIPVEVTGDHGGNESEWPTALRGCRAFPKPAARIAGSTSP